MTRGAELLQRANEVNFDGHVRDFRSEDFMTIATNLKPLSSNPFLDEFGSYSRDSVIRALPDRPNEWVVTQPHAPLPGDDTYGIGNPLEMRAWHAPGAGQEARRIMELGRRPDQALPTDRQITTKEALENNFVFLQLYGKRGTEYGGDTGNVACITTGMSWDRQTSYEDAARDIANHVAGRDDAPIVWFGPHKFLVMVKGSQKPEEMIQRMVDAPREPYKKYLPHLSDAQNEIQDMRIKDILDPESGTGKEFIAHFNGEDLPLKRAFRENGRLSFVWKNEVRGHDLVAINPDGNEQTMMSLIERGYKQDIDMKNKLYVVNTNLVQKNEENVYFIEVNFDPTATCCGFSTNAQQEGSRWKEQTRVDLQEAQATSRVYAYPNGEIYLGGETKDGCWVCGKSGKDCKGHANQETTLSE